MSDGQRVIAVVNVRLGSTRLPGKALREVCGRPLLGHLLERLRLAKSVDRIVVATSTAPLNDAVEAFCTNAGVACFRGSEDDVLGRTVGALRSMNCETAVLVFGDGPLIDPAIVDGMVTAFFRLETPHDFLGNDLKTTFPPGMEVEVFTIGALADAERRCDDPVVREHGTLFLRLNPDLYRIANVEATPPLRRPDVSLEVDTVADLAVIEEILSNFSDRTDYTLAEIIRFLDERPDVAAINRDTPRRWKAYRADA